MNTVLSKIQSLGKQVVPEGSRLMLFGSRARGDFRADSDWDLLILLNKNKITSRDYDEITYPFAELGWQIGEMIHPIIYTKNDWEKKSFSPFYKNVMKEGITL
jgi:predicted nucleotidyltransferase